MNTMKCDRCGEGKMRRVLIPDYKTKLGGMPLTIPEASVFQCENCGDIAVEAGELRRWRQIQSEFFRKTAALPSSADIEKIRQRLGISVAEFALLLAVTRQTVHGWEHGRLQPGPAAILIHLIESELEGNIFGVIDTLRRLAIQRGTPVELALSETLSITKNL